MKVLRDEIEHYLEEQPLARERSNKDRAIVNVLLKNPVFFPIAKAVREDLIDPKLLTRFIQDHASTDRAWRKILNERPELRGKDYENKDELEHETRLNLGYKN